MNLIQSLSENLLGKWLDIIKPDGRKSRLEWGKIKPDLFAGLFSPSGQALLFYGSLLYIGNRTPTHSERILMQRRKTVPSMGWKEEILIVRVGWWEV